MTLAAAEAHYEERARLAALTSHRAGQLWDRVYPDDLDSWQRLIPQMSATVAAAQYRAATTADDYIAFALAEQDIAIAAVGNVNPGAFVGTTSDGRPLASLLDQPRIAAMLAIADGLDVIDALTRGRSQLQTIAATQVQDIGRAADSVAMFARPRVGYVRMVNAPCCSRCAILAGKFFRANQGFQRHPRCDCLHIPATENVGGDIGTDPQALVASGKVQGLNRAELDALAEGADLNQIVNARRGRSGMTTSEGTTRRGTAGRRLRGRQRLTPDAIYRTAATRDDALRLLEQHGYLSPRRRSVAVSAPLTPESAAQDLVRRAAGAEPELTRTVTTLAEKTGGETVGLDFRLKTEGSLTRKIAGDVDAGEGTVAEIASKMFDVNRYTIRYADDTYAASVKATTDALIDEGYQLKVKNYWTNTKNPYQGVNVQVTSPDGGQWELQFHTPTSLEIKEGEMHTIYEASRVETDPAKIAEYNEQSFAASAKIPVPPGILDFSPP